MKLSANLLAIALFSLIWVEGARTASADDDPQGSRQLSLADLAGYRAALSGKPTADLAKASDAPVQASFRDLWNRPDVFRGRRITIEGRVARVFRQGPLGSFPSLAEVWITSPAGDPFLAVSPQPESTELDDSGVATPEEKHGDAGPTVVTSLELGKAVRFTGTFLKMVRYTGGDGARLAPLIVGDRPPAAIVQKPPSGHFSAEAVANQTGGNSHPGMALGPVYWALGLAVMALGAVTLARWHLRMPARPTTERRISSPPSITDPPLEFVEPHDGS